MLELELVLNNNLLKYGLKRMVAMSALISQIKKEDIASCAKLYVEVFNAEPWNDKWTLENAQKRLNDIYDAPNFVGSIYLDKGIIKGAIFGNCEQYYNGMHYYLKEMFISPEYWISSCHLMACRQITVILQVL